MTSIQALITRNVLQVHPYGWAKGTIDEQRSRQEKSTRFFKIPEDIQCQPVKIKDINAEWITCSAAKNRVILYLHGGAYAVGSVNVHREFLSRLVKACQSKTLAIDYRLAPEHPFPAALEDSISAYNWLIFQGYDPSSIVIAGDSAGGGLAIATLIALRDREIPLPSCAVCISPWVDLSSSCENSNHDNDPILNPEILSTFARYYAGQTELTNPLISPVYANLQGLSPILIQVGTNEILLDQVKEFYDKACQANLEIILDCWQGLFHVFQIVPFIPETKLSLGKIADFIVTKIDRNP